MNLFDIISVKRSPILEGGNLSSHNAQGKEIPGWQGVPGTHQAQELDLQVHNRNYVQDVVEKLLADINTTFSNQYKEPLWYPKSVEAKKFLSGSTLLFLDKKISDEDFVRVKPKVGDIDTQAPDKHAETIKQFLQSLVGKKVGDAVFLGFSPGNSQYSSLWEIKLKELPVKIQIDFEYGAHDEEGLPTEWQSYSHSSAWEDLSANIKGVFHKYIDRALPYARTSTKYVARVLKKGTKISDEPVTDSDFSFAVSGPGGGGLSRKYVPYNDPNTGEPMEKNGVPVMQLLEPNARQYVQNLAQQFELFFGRKPKGNDQELKNSFVGTVALIAKYLPNDEKEEIVSRFLSICFEQGSQMITKDDPARDRDIKFAAIDYMLENIKLPNAKSLRAQAVKMAADYEAAFTNKVATRQPVAENFADGRNPQDKGDSKRHGINTKASVSSLRKTAKQGGRKGQLAHWLANMKAGKAKHEGLNEAEVKAQLRKGMPHLKDLKAVDFLDLLDEIHDGNGNFKLENMPLNVKVDGFGGRFGKNADGKPFMGTSRTEPRYAPGFLKYHQEKGTQDPEILGRAKLFDDLFVEMMNAVKLVDSKLGPDFLMDKQVSCEVLFLPFATETEEGKLKFVGIQYDKLPKGVQLALVPFQVVTASTGEPVENSQEVVKELTGLGQQGSVMFIDNSLTQNEALDVTAIVPPLENIEELKSIVSDTMGKRDRASLELKKNVEAQLQPVKLALEKAIAEDPNIVGKDMLGKDYEGIVLNTRLGPVKITSAEQRAVIAGKQAAQASARAERPRGEAKTAVVAVGSFIGHKGHQDLFQYTINKAKELGGDPYLFIGNAEGKDDPIPPAVKVQTWHKLYPEYADNISTVQQGGQLIQKIKHELINPLPGKPPRYDNIVIMVGEDRKGLSMPQALMKAVNKFQGYEHVKASLGVTPRESGFSGTLLRNSLKNDPPEKALAVWSNAFDVKKLGGDWIEHLMDITRKGMGIQQQTQQQPAPIAERLFNALIRPKIDENTRMSAAVKLQRAFQRQQEKSTASRKRGEEVMSQARTDWEKKQAAEKNKEQGAAEENESIMGFLTMPKHPVAKKSTTSPEEMRRYFEKDKPSKPEKIERGNGGNTVQQVYRRSTEEQSVSELFEPSTDYYILSNGKMVQVDYRPGTDGQSPAPFTDVKVSYVNPALKPQGPSFNSTGQAERWDRAPDGVKQAIEKFVRQPQQGVAEGSSGAKYKVRSIGQDKKGEYYISPSTGEKIYKKAKVGDHEVPGSKEIKPRVAESEKTSQAEKSEQSSQDKETKVTPSQIEKNKEKWEPKQDKKGSNFDKTAESYNIKERSKYWTAKLNELEKNQFVGVKQNPLGTAGHLKATDKYAKAGDLVGEVSVDEKIKGADGKACWDGYRYDGTENDSDKCVKVSEDIENKMSNLIRLLENK